MRLLPEGSVSDQLADSLSIHAEVAEACEGDGRSPLAVAQSLPLLPRTNLPSIFPPPDTLVGKTGPPVLVLHHIDVCVYTG